jgi:hypothetical protein
MQEIGISKSKPTCLAVLENVHRTRTPVRVTRFGKQVAEIRPPSRSSTKSWLGCMRESCETPGDLVEPIGAFQGWVAGQE